MLAKKSETPSPSAPPPEVRGLHTADLGPAPSQAAYGHCLVAAKGPPLSVADPTAAHVAAVVHHSPLG